MCHNVVYVVRSSCPRHAECADPLSPAAAGSKRLLAHHRSRGFHRTRGAAATLGSLIRLAEPLGLPDRHVRTSIGRLALEGWLTSVREGRRSEYSLTEHGKSRFAEATARIYRAAPGSWDGNWTLVLLGSSDLKSAREELLWLGFGQVRPGVLAHPNLSVEETRRQLDELKVNGSTVVLRAASEGASADREPVEPPGGIWRRSVGAIGSSSRFSHRFRMRLSGSPEPETAFVIRTLLIHEYRKIHLRDPQLPHSLLPEDWIGARAYELCRALYRNGVRAC